MRPCLLAVCLFGVGSALGHDEDAVSLLQVSGKPLPAERILRNETKFRHVSARFFKRADANGDSAVSMEEAHTFFLRLVDAGRIPRLPTPSEFRIIKNLAGNDKVLSPSEFEDTVRVIAEMLEWEGHFVNPLSENILAEELLRNKAKLSRVAERFFFKADTDKNSVVDVMEAKLLFAKLVEKGRLPRLPTHRETMLLEQFAGDDGVFQADEFELAVRAVMKWPMSTPMLVKLTRNDDKRSRLSKRLFKKADIDGNNAIDMDEAQIMIKKLVDSGRFPRMPSPKEWDLLKTMAGEDELLQLDELNQLVGNVAQLLSTPASQL